MPEGIDIEVRNEQLAEKRVLNINHHAKKDVYLINHDTFITRQFRKIG